MSNLNTDQENKAKELRDKLAKEFNEEEAKEFAQNYKDKSWFEDFNILLKMLLDPTYKLSSKTKMLIMGTLAYVILPIDVVPDFIPIVGWLDDIFILGYATHSLKEDIEAYKASKGMV